MTCNSGYYHGVIELSISGKPRNEIVPIVRKLCADPAVTRTPSCSTSACTASGTG